MKLLYIVCLISLFSCGKNLIGEVEDIAPYGLKYTPDSIFFDTTIYPDTTTNPPFFNQGSGSVLFEITSPKIGALSIDPNTGTISVTNVIAPNIYTINVRIRNFAGGTSFPEALILEVK